MLKRIIWLGGVVMLLAALAGCQQPASPTALPQEPSSTATATAAKPTATVTVLPTLTPASEPGPTSEPPWQIPQIREEDWTRGGAEAGLVIVEYSDLQ